MKTIRNTEAILDRDLSNYWSLHEIFDRAQTIEKGLLYLKDLLAKYEDKRINMSRDELVQTIKEDQILNYSYSWPLVVHLFSGTFCLGCSGIFHLFQIQSKNLYEVFSRLDYGGISVLVMGSSYPVIYYCFKCSPVFLDRNLFLALITTTSIGTFIVMVMPGANGYRWQIIRAFLYSFLGLSAGLPFWYLSATKQKNWPYYLPDANYQPWLLGGVIYIAGSMIYGFKIPERFVPTSE